MLLEVLKAQAFMFGRLRWNPAPPDRALSGPGVEENLLDLTEAPGKLQQLTDLVVKDWTLVT